MQDNRASERKKRDTIAKRAEGEERVEVEREDGEKHRPYANYALTRKIVSRFTEGV